MKHYFIGLTASLFICFSGIRASVGDTHYAATNMLSVAPYTNWANAASNIQLAVDATGAGDTVLVSNGVYDVGGMTNYPAGTLLTNRVVITSAITVTSVNGASVTLIKGAYSSNGQTNGLDSVRCVYMTAGRMAGFTLTNGSTMALNQPVPGTNLNHYGAGVYCPSLTPVISNCVIVGNSSAYMGGGTYYGTFYNTAIRNNRAANHGGGGNFANYSGCAFSNNAGYSSVANSTLSNCAVLYTIGGWGTHGCYLVNCLIAYNSGNTYAGVVYTTPGYWLKNCTIVSNYGTTCGGAYFTASTTTVENCVIYDNHNGSDDQNRNIYSASGVGKGIFTNCCVTPTNSSSIAAGSTNNIESDPQFMNKSAGDWRLNANSPCINAGMNRNWMTNGVDLDGRARIRYGTVDMGAYETIFKGTVYRLGF